MKKYDKIVLSYPQIVFIKKVLDLNNAKTLNTGYNGRMIRILTDGAYTDDDRTALNVIGCNYRDYKENGKSPYMYKKQYSYDEL